MIKSYKNFLIERSDSSDGVESISDICNKYGIKNYIINEDGSIDVDGSVYLYDEGLTKLPLKFGKVTGEFNCSRNQLTSLEGCPKEVGGFFSCFNNKLTTLKGAPEKVGGNFYCFDNKLTTLEGAPKEVGGGFWCSYNGLTSLEGAPKKVGNFDCSYNELISLIGGPQIVIGSYCAYDNKIVSFEGFPDDYEGYVEFAANPVQEVLEQFPENLRTKAIHLINDYDAIWQGEVVPERMEMVKEKLGLL